MTSETPGYLAVWLNGGIAVCENASEESWILIPLLNWLNGIVAEILDRNARQRADYPL